MNLRNLWNYVKELSIERKTDIMKVTSRAVVQKG